MRNLIAHKSFEYDPVEYLLIEDKKLAYIVISKAACTSIKVAIGKIMNIFPDDPDGSDIHMKIENKCINGLLPHEVKQQFDFFTFVRNPYERLVSCYEDKVLYNPDKAAKNKYYFENYPVTIPPNSSFANFVSLVSKIPDFISDRHFKSQNYTIQKNKVNCILGKFENLNRDWNDNLSKHGINVEIGHYNRGNYVSHDNEIPDFYSYYDKRTFEMVSKRYKKDIHNFGYENEQERLKEYLGLINDF